MSSIKTALMKLEDVAELSINKETETVTVDASCNRNVLVSALLKLGYPEKGNNNVLHKAKSYVSCVAGNLTN